MSNEDVILRAGRPEEASYLSALALRSKAHWGYGEAFMAACVDELSLSKEDISKFGVVVAERDGAVIGFYGLARHSKDRVELEALFVEPAFIGFGVGRRLMEDAKRRAREFGADVMEIQADPNASRFYQATGGVIVSKTPSASIPGRTLPYLEIDLTR